MICFRQERDYLVYLALLTQISKETSCDVHAYCLMSNHIHLLVTPDTADGCSTLMKALAQRYSYYFNREHDRTGPLWEGRFRSSIVKDSRYTLACYRYIEMNPVRAGIVRHPSEYAWSSFAANVALRTDSLVSPHSEFSAIGPSAYARLVECVLEQEVLFEIRAATQGGHLLGEKVPPKKRGRPAKEKESVSDTDLFSAGGAS